MTKIKTRLISTLLCVVMAFSIIPQKPIESYAFYEALAPEIYQVMVTVLAAMGLTFATEQASHDAVDNVWAKMSDTDKVAFTALAIAWVNGQSTVVKIGALWPKIKTIVVNLWDSYIIGLGAGLPLTFPVELSYLTGATTVADTYADVTTRPAPILLASGSYTNANQTYSTGAMNLRVYNTSSGAPRYEFTLPGGTVIYSEGDIYSQESGGMYFLQPQIVNGNRLALWVGRGTKWHLTTCWVLAVGTQMAVMQFNSAGNLCYRLSGDATLYAMSNAVYDTTNTWVAFQRAMYDVIYSKISISYTVATPYYNGDTTVLPQSWIDAECPVVVPATPADLLTLTPAQAVAIPITFPVGDVGEAAEKLQMPNIFTDKFPFSIPYDFVASIGILAAPAVTPVYVIPFKFERLGIDETVTIDFHQFDTLAAIMRWFLSALFLFGLILATRKLIWK